MNQNVYQLINAPTRISRTTDTIIDHIYLKTKTPITAVTGIFNNIISDHLATFIIINNHNKLLPKDRPIMRIMRKQQMINSDVNLPS